LHPVNHAVPKKELSLLKVGEGGNRSFYSTLQVHREFQKDTSRLDRVLKHGRQTVWVCLVVFLMELAGTILALSALIIRVSEYKVQGRQPFFRLLIGGYWQYLLALFTPAGILSQSLCFAVDLWD
jgi:hypothetical protein